MGTNRKEMRKLLDKIIALMKEAFDCGLNMDIYTRLKMEDNNLPWFTGFVWKEGNLEGRIEFACYEWRSVEENENQINKVKVFIEDNK